MGFPTNFIFLPRPPALSHTVSLLFCSTTQLTMSRSYYSASHLSASYYFHIYSLYLRRGAQVTRQHIQRRLNDEYPNNTALHQGVKDVIDELIRTGPDEAKAVYISRIEVIILQRFDAPTQPPAPQTTWLTAAELPQYLDRTQHTLQHRAFSDSIHLAIILFWLLLSCYASCCLLLLIQC